MSTYDLIVLGLGATGSAALYQSARAGANVLGIDRYDPPHDLGSSHGDTRITRLAIGEGTHYTPLVKRSHEIWRAIERETGESLLVQTGGLIISSPAKSSFTHVEAFFDNTVAAARQHGIAHELLDTAQLRSRFPQFAAREGETGYYEPDAGYLRPEACIRAQLTLARRHGAELRNRETVTGFAQSGNFVTVTTDKGEYRAATLIVAAGAWLPHLLPPELARPFTVHRQVLYWFDADPALFAPARCPIFIWELQTTRQGVYGFPMIDSNGVKIATEQYADTTTPEDVSREVSPDEIATMYETLVRPNLPGVSARCTRTATCLYTVTPDFQFVIDRHPEMNRVILASPCSGHGFKHSAALGEALTAMAAGRESPFDLSPFRLSRF